MHDRKYDNSVENVENGHWLMKNSNETLCSSSEKQVKKCLQILKLSAWYLEYRLYEQRN